MARWTASAKWAAGPALDGRRATLLGLGLNEGLGFSAFRRAAGRSCMHGIVLLLRRHCKSSRGTPRLRPAPRFLHGALRLALPEHLASRSFVCFPKAATVDGGGTNNAAAALGGFSLFLKRQALTEATSVFRLSFFDGWQLRHSPFEAPSKVSWLFSSRRQAHFLLESCTAAFLKPNVRAKRATTAGRQARAGENVPRTARPGLVACRWRSA